MERSDQNSTDVLQKDDVQVTGSSEAPGTTSREQSLESPEIYQTLILGQTRDRGVRSGVSIRPSVSEDRRITPSECECGAANAVLVYALGQVGYDFGFEARRDSFMQHGARDPYDPRQFLTHLSANVSQATAVIWTLSQDATPIYAIRPAGPFAVETYERLREFVNAQLEEGVERVSIPGVISGKETLMNGQVVPVIYPELRGMYSWSTKALLAAVLGKPPEKSAKQELTAYHKREEGVGNFLERVYDEMRNLGLSPQERALNYAATNAFQAQQVFQKAIEEEMQLDTIEVEKSAISRPGSDCWDVRLTFFNPARRFEQARKVYRFTVDVSDVVPVTVGTVRQWNIY